MFKTKSTASDCYYLSNYILLSNVYVMFYSTKPCSTSSLSWKNHKLLYNIQV